MSRERVRTRAFSRQSNTQEKEKDDETERSDEMETESDSCSVLSEASDDGSPAEMSEAEEISEKRGSAEEGEGSLAGSSEGREELEETLREEVAPTRNLRKRSLSRASLASRRPSPPYPAPPTPRAVSRQKSPSQSLTNLVLDMEEGEFSVKVHNLLRKQTEQAGYSLGETQFVTASLVRIKRDQDQVAKEKKQLAKAQEEISQRLASAFKDAESGTENAESISRSTSPSSDQSGVTQELERLQQEIADNFAIQMTEAAKIRSLEQELEEAKDATEEAEEREEHLEEENQRLLAELREKERQESELEEEKQRLLAELQEKGRRESELETKRSRLSARLREKEIADEKLGEERRLLKEALQKEKSEAAKEQEAKQKLFDIWSQKKDAELDLLKGQLRECERNRTEDESLKNRLEEQRDRYRVYLDKLVDNNKKDKEEALEQAKKAAKDQVERDTKRQREELASLREQYERISKEKDEFEAQLEAATDSVRRLRMAMAERSETLGGDEEGDSSSAQRKEDSDLVQRQLGVIENLFPRTSPNERPFHSSLSYEEPNTVVFRQDLEGMPEERTSTPRVSYVGSGQEEGEDGKEKPAPTPPRLSLSIRSDEPSGDEEIRLREAIEAQREILQKKDKRRGSQDDQRRGEHQKSYTGKDRQPPLQSSRPSDGMARFASQLSLHPETCEKREDKFEKRSRESRRDGREEKKKGGGRKTRRHGGRRGSPSSSPDSRGSSEDSRQGGRRGSGRGDRRTRSPTGSRRDRSPSSPDESPRRYRRSSSRRQSSRDSDSGRRDGRRPRDSSSESSPRRPSRGSSAPSRRDGRERRSSRSRRYEEYPRTGGQDPPSPRRSPSRISAQATQVLQVNFPQSIEKFTGKAGQNFSDWFQFFRYEMKRRNVRLESEEALTILQCHMRGQALTRVKQLRRHRRHINAKEIAEDLREFYRRDENAMTAHAQLKNLRIEDCYNYNTRSILNRVETLYRMANPEASTRQVQRGVVSHIIHNSPAKLNQFLLMKDGNLLNTGNIDDLREYMNQFANISVFNGERKINNPERDGGSDSEGGKHRKEEKKRESHPDSRGRGWEKPPSYGQGRYDGRPPNFVAPPPPPVQWIREGFGGLGNYGREPLPPPPRRDDWRPPNPPPQPSFRAHQQAPPQPQDARDRFYHDQRQSTFPSHQPQRPPNLSPPNNMSLGQGGPRPGQGQQPPPLPECQYCRRRHPGPCNAIQKNGGQVRAVSQEGKLPTTAKWDKEETKKTGCQRCEGLGHRMENCFLPSSVQTTNFL